MWGKSHPAIFSSKDIPEKGTLKRKSKVPAAPGAALPPVWHCLYWACVQPLHLPHVCVYDFCQQKRAVRTCLAGGRSLTLSTYLPIGTSIWQLACSFLKPNRGSAILVRVLWHHFCNCHYTINFNAFLIPNAAFFSSVQGKMGSYTTGNPTAATNPVSNYLIFIALNTSLRPILQPHCIQPLSISIFLLICKEIMEISFKKKPKVCIWVHI